jgi:type VI secretion system secreted protein Hcp
MAQNAFLTLKGQKQGDIHGGVTQKGREGSILVHSFSNEILSSRDPTSGLLTGKRQHLPVVILKEIDKSSPLLWSALVNNENLVTWELKFWAPALAGGAGAGVEKQIYTINLTNASIASIREYMLDNDDPALARFPLLEEVTFTYQKIQWAWTDGGITAQDDWESPIT